MNPLQTLFESAADELVPLPPGLAEVYGPLHLPLNAGRPYTIANFVSSLDGVVALNVPGKLTGGGEINGPAPQDHVVMGVLRALADVIVVGAGTVRSAPRHLWTADYVSRQFSAEHRALRESLGKAATPLNVVVTSIGGLNMEEPLFSSGQVSTMVIATEQAAREIRPRAPGSVRIVEVPGKKVEAGSILDAVSKDRQVNLLLCEGGPQLIGTFFAEHCLDELFLTLAPQIAGRDASVVRPGLVGGQLFAPDNPIWGTLLSVKRGDSHLFLRYRFER